jgi:hypothetical protein
VAKEHLVLSQPRHNVLSVLKELSLMAMVLLMRTSVFTVSLDISALKQVLRQCTRLLIAKKDIIASIRQPQTACMGYPQPSAIMVTKGHKDLQICSSVKLDTTALRVPERLNTFRIHALKDSFVREVLLELSQ